MNSIKSIASRRKKFSDKNLKQLNLIAAGLLAIQALVIIIISSSSAGLRPITISFLTTDQLASRVSSSSVLASATHRIFDLNLAYVVAAFMLVSALGCLLAVTRYRKVYQADLKAGINRQRWISFSVTGSLMMVAIAMVVGVFDLSTLLLIAGLTALAGLLGLLLEVVKPANWLNYWFGLGAAVLPWVVLVIYLWGSHVYGSPLPAYIYWVFITMLLLFASIIINNGFQRQKIGHWEDYIFGERMFIILSLLAQSALAWQIFAGTLH